MSDDDAIIAENQQIYELFRQLSNAEQAIHALIDERLSMTSRVDNPTGLLRQIQDSLQESEARYHHLINRISALVCELDAAGTILMVNDAVARVTGYRPEELIGANWWGVLFPGPYSKEARALIRRLRSGDVVNYEITLQARDGSPVTLEFNTANYYDPLGRLSKIVAFATDISARRQAEEKARSSEQKLAQVQELAHMDQWTWDFKNQRLTFSGELSRILGVDLSESRVEVDKIFNLIHPSDRRLVQRAYNEALIGRRPVQVNHRIVRPDGTIRVVVTHGEISFDDQGDPVSMNGSVQDITDRKLFEEQLHLREQLLHMVIANAPLALLLVDLAGMIRLSFGNGPIQSSHPQDLIGKSIYDVYAGTPEILTNFERTVKGELVTSVVQSDGLAWEVRSAPFRAENGEIASVIQVVIDITERVKKDEALNEREARLRTILEQIPAVLWSTDQDLNYTYSSGSGLAALGLHPGDLDGTPLTHFSAQKEIVEIVYPAHHRALQGQRSSYMTDWKGRMLQCFVEPFRSTAGEIIGTIGVALDVTPLKEAEQAIRERDIRFRAAVEASLDAIYILKAERDENGEVVDFQVVEMNSVGEAQLKMPREQVVGQHLRARFAGPETEKIFQIYVQVMKTGAPVDDEYQLTPQGGSPEWFHYQVVPLPDGVAVSHRNITPRKEIEQALQESEKRYRDIVETAGEGIWTADKEDKILFANQLLCQLLGYTLDEVLGERIFQFLSTESRLLLVARMDRWRPEVKETLDLRFIKKDGSDLWTMVTVTPVYDDQHQYRGSLGMITDIHHRKAMEAELAEMRRRLMESREQERLQLAQDLHDGPIQDLYGMVFLVNSLRQAGPDLDERVLGQVNTHLNQVIGTLRHVCGELRPPTLTPFGLEKAIRSHAEAFRSAHPEMKMRLELMRDGQRLSEPVRVALFRIYQSMLSNTVRHARAHHVVVRLNLNEVSVILEILDDGVGFAVPVRLIELARQGHFGIVGAYERAEAVGGKVDIFSSPGKGTRVRVTVPLDAAK